MRTKMFLAMLLALAFVRCTEDEIAPVLIEGNTEYELEVGERITLSPTIENLDGGETKWYINNELVAETPEYTYTATDACVDTLRFVARNTGGEQELTYQVQSFGKYAEGVFVVCFSSGENCGSLGFLNADGYSSRVFYSENKEGAPVDNLLSATVTGNEIFLISQSGPAFVSIANVQTLKLHKRITDSEANAPGFLVKVREQAYVVNTDRNGRTIHTLNLAGSAIGAEIYGIEDVPAIKSSVLEYMGNVLVVDGKSLKKIDPSNGSVSTVLTFLDNVSGIVTDKEGNIWIGTEGRKQTARFMKLDQNLEIAETADLGEAVKMYRNGILTSSGTKYFYWQEPSTGNIHRFDTETKEQELFVSPMTLDLFMTTALKENPVTGDVYLGGVTNFFDTSKSKILVLGSDSAKKEEYNNVGNSPIDFVFVNKDMYRKK